MPPPRSPGPQSASVVDSTKPVTRATPITTFLLLVLSLLPFQLQHHIRMLLSHLPSKHRLPTGTCTLVGAGPGDPGLLTMRAHGAIRNADIVISDLLVSPKILAMVRGKLLKLPRTTRNRSDDAQKDANEWMARYAHAGLVVCRLKGGDPFVFGRGGEEVLYLRSHGISESQITVVPGISSCIAAAESALIPVTHRGLADQFLVITGRGQGGRVPTIPRFTPRRTLVIMMGMNRMSMLVATLRDEAAYPPHTPVAVVEKATWREQRVVTGTVETIERIVADEGVANPAVVYVGNVVLALRGGVDETMENMVNPADEGIELGPSRSDEEESCEIPPVALASGIRARQIAI
ncbi:tetrapyrrole methylase [Powellomyces hirtus]|nr:tetrapyrrole methylase [Powellomyces hirtus]